MTREQAKELLPIIQAFAEGKTIQFKSIDDKWDDFYNKEDKLSFDSPIHKYRIKPEPKYRPFANKEECWQEMLKHQPFGWTKSISEKCFYFISKIDDKGCFFSNNDGVSFKTLFASDKFADGTPFGIKE
jgi:hypothetical protein